MALEVPILEVNPPPAYQRIADKVKHLRELSMSRAAIARRVGADRKTVAKALRWLEDLKDR